MANSRVQIEVENWIRDQWLPPKYGQTFIKKSLRLETGGYFEFDAVSADARIVINISTSSSRTVSGKSAAGPIHKIRGDMLFLLMAPADQRLIVFCQKDMCDWWQVEKRRGRVPIQIEFDYAEIPTNLAKKLVIAKRSAAQEVLPRKE